MHLRQMPCALGHQRHIRTRRSLLIILLCLTSLIVTPAHGASEEELPLCTKYQACAAEITRFPLLSETVGNIAEEPEAVTPVEGSGEGSEEEVEQTTSTAFPFYDEVVETQSPLFDYQADSEVSVRHICRCPEEEDDDTSGECGFSSQDQIMDIDKSIRLSFCKPVVRLLPSCKGRRGLLRIIGDVDTKSGEGIAEINTTVVFCRCPFQFQRMSIEPWSESYSFNYRCKAMIPPSASATDSETD